MWHGSELYSASAGDAIATSAPIGYSESIRWRHVQAVVRLFQVIHIVADVISDWDCVVDSFDQLVTYFNASRGSNLVKAGSSMSPPVVLLSGSNTCATPLETDKIIQAIDRFKVFSLYLSDDALVKLMTSLVALSINNLALSPIVGKSSSGNFSNTSIGNDNFDFNIYDANPNEILGRMSIGFCLNSVIEITKINVFRISTVWQMVTSHLRMIASLKVGLLIYFILYVDQYNIFRILARNYYQSPLPSTL